MERVKNMNNSSLLSIAGYFGNALTMKVLLAHKAPWGVGLGGGGGSLNPKP